MKSRSSTQKKIAAQSVRNMLFPIRKNITIPMKKNINAVIILRYNALMKVFPSVGSTDILRMTLANIPRLAATEKKRAYSVILA